MEKRKIIIISSVVVIVLLIILLITLTIISVEEKKTNKNKETTTLENLDKKIAAEQLSWGVENQTELAQKAVKEFALQSSTESVDSRDKRLLKYFSENSPVYDYGTTNLEPPITKSSGKVGAVNYCEEQEGGDLCLLVAADTEFSSLTENNSIKQTYWITIKKVGDNKFKAYDLGILE